ncbi:MAG TPA: tyrosine-type recombinase/integrase [Gemmatimonadales bacterium]|nr:tyrosine-type recombinase/integrase [Gemmatimonadales bacterium]
MHRISKGGTYRIDRVFPRVGRIAVASGATTKDEFKKRNGLLTRLYDHGRLDLLRAIKAGTYTVTEVYATERDDPTLARLTGERAILAQPLWAAVETWMGRPLWGKAAEDWDGAEPGPTRKRYGVSFKALRARAGLADTATIDALGALDWKALKATWPNAGADWNHLRRAVSHFLADQLGDVQHPFRRALFQKQPGSPPRFPKGAEVERVPDLDVPTFWRIVHQTPEFVRPAFVTIAYLGLRVGEFLRLTDTDLLPATKQVRIPGTKTEASAATLPVADAMWPWITRAIPSPLGYKWLREYWVRARTAAGAGDVRIHDLRHFPAQLLVNAGRSEASVQSTMRHATPGMTRRYAKQRDRGENAQALAEVMLA